MIIQAAWNSQIANRIVRGSLFEGPRGRYEDLRHAVDVPDSESCRTGLDGSQFTPLSDLVQEGERNDFRLTAGLGWDF